MDQKKDKNSLYYIIPKDEIQVPPIPFPKFYKKFKTVEEMIKTREWKEYYSQFFTFDQYEKTIAIGETREEMESYSAYQILQETIKCSYSFAYFCHKYVKIMHPIHGLIPCVQYKYQKRVVLEFQNNRFNIISKFRQGGLTTMAGLWSLWRCLFQTDQQIILLSKSDREALSAGDIVQRALDNLPNWLKSSLSTDSKHEKIFSENDSSLKFYTPKAARGKSATIIIIDEAAFIDGMDVEWKAMYPTIATGGSAIVISTVNGLGNWYEEWYHAAETKENQFNVIDLEYWEHPDYCDPVWVEDTKRNLGEKGWMQEVLRSFLGSGETYIPSHIISELIEYTRTNQPIRILLPQWQNHTARKIDWEPGAMWLWREPIDGHEYILAVDCSLGCAGGDNNAFQILDTATLEQVGEFYSDNIPPGPFASVIELIGVYYNHALVVIEANGVGGAILSDLQRNHAYENIHYESRAGSKIQKMGISTGKDNRLLHLETLQNRILNGSVKINSRRLVDELKTFVHNSKTHRAEAQKNKHDDAVMSMSLALYVRDTLMYSAPIGMDDKPDMKNSFDNRIYEEIRKEILRDSPKNYIEESMNSMLDILNRNDTTPEGFFETKQSAFLREFGFL